jgi:hypothetical protein
MLKHLYGACPEDITWFNGGCPSQRYSTLLDFNDHRSNVVLHEPEEGRSLNDLLMRGEIAN